MFVGYLLDLSGRSQVYIVPQRLQRENHLWGNKVFRKKTMSSRGLSLKALMQTLEVSNLLTSIEYYIRYAVVM